MAFVQGPKQINTQALPKPWDKEPGPRACMTLTSPLPSLPGSTLTSDFPHPPSHKVPILCAQPCVRTREEAVYGYHDGQMGHHKQTSLSPHAENAAIRVDGPRPPPARGPLTLVDSGKREGQQPSKATPRLL